MRKLTPLLLMLLLFNISLSQDSLPLPPNHAFDNTIGQAKPYKKYFFEGVNFIEENKDLVIIVKEPQTQFAKDFGHKIYTDSNFLRSIQQDLFKTIDPSFVEDEIIDFCGYDMYFYIKSGPNLKLFKEVNSNCGFGNTNCSFLTMFDENGQQLKVDTIRKFNRRQNFYSLIDDDFVYGSFVTLHHHGELWQDYRDGNHYFNELSNNVSYPNSMYDGHFELNLKVDTLLSVFENLEIFFNSHGIDSLAFRQINFIVKNRGDTRITKSDPYSPLFPRKEVLVLTIFLNEHYFQNFGEYEIRKREKSKRRKRAKFELEPLLILSKY